MALRFQLGDFVMCNMGSAGWKLGRVIALNYREAQWPAGMKAPYQVALEDDRALIYVPEDNPSYCKAAAPEDLRIANRPDALAALPPGVDGPESDSTLPQTGTLGCREGEAHPGIESYRNGRCQGCTCDPRSWSSAELYSEHYRCAARNGLKVTRHAVALGTLQVGDSLNHPAIPALPKKGGFMQCPTLVRLPPGLRFTDDGALSGVVRFDPHREAAYNVDFVAVSTADWEDPAIGIVRLEISFSVEGNAPPKGFDKAAFVRQQQHASEAAEHALDKLGEVWTRWQQGELGNRATCDRMLAELRRLRELLEANPRLDGGIWWAQLGGYHMNVHKLLENTLFECELYLGHALTFGDAGVRRVAEQNLEGCFPKRLLEAARFMWAEGAQQMMRGEWALAVETMRLAAEKKEGWGWAVNYGDIWLAESAARIVIGVTIATGNESKPDEAARWFTDATQLLQKCEARSEESAAFGPAGHPWASEVRAALDTYHVLQKSGADATEWLESFKLRTTYWCAQILGGASPFPPKLRPRHEDAAELIRRLPGYNA